MKLILDMNMSAMWNSTLRAAGHESVHWSSLGPVDAPDPYDRVLEATNILLLAPDLMDTFPNSAARYALLTPTVLDKPDKL